MATKCEAKTVNVRATGRAFDALEGTIDHHPKCAVGQSLLHEIPLGAEEVSGGRVVGSEKFRNSKSGGVDSSSRRQSKCCPTGRQQQKQKKQQWQQA